AVSDIDAARQQLAALTQKPQIEPPFQPGMHAQKRVERDEYSDVSDSRYQHGPPTDSQNTFALRIPKSRLLSLLQTLDQMGKLGIKSSSANKQRLNDLLKTPVAPAAGQRANVPDKRGPFLSPPPVRPNLKAPLDADLISISVELQPQSPH